MNDPLPAQIYLWLGEQRGPFPQAEVEKMVSDKTIAAETLGWREGMAEWEPITSILPAASRPKSKLRLRPPRGDGADTPDSAGALGSTASPERCEPMSSYYRWPQFGPNIGICPPGEEPPNRTASNGIRMTTKEFVKILRSAVEGDPNSQWELVQIFEENAEIEPDMALAAKLREMAANYWARYVSQGGGAITDDPAVPDLSVPNTLMAPDESASAVRAGLRLRLRQQEEPAPVAISLALNEVIVDPEEIWQIVGRAREGDVIAMAQLGDIYRENARQEADQGRAARFAQKAHEWVHAASQGCASTPPA